MTAVCAIPLSKPEATLSWYINSDSADPKYVSNQSENSEFCAKETVPYSVLQLEFTLTQKHLVLPRGGFSLKCTAEVLDLYWKSTEVATQVASPPTSWLQHAFVSSLVASKLSCNLVNIALSLSLLFFK